MKFGTTRFVSVDQPKSGIVGRLFLVPLFSRVRRTLALFLGQIFRVGSSRRSEGRPGSHDSGHSLCGRPVLMISDEGSLRCVACSLCSAACPSDCIRTEAEEYSTAEGGIGGRRPATYEIDLLRCIFCGSCVDACPEEAIVLSRDRQMVFTDRRRAVAGIQDLSADDGFSESDVGYRSGS